MRQVLSPINAQRPEVSGGRVEQFANLVLLHGTRLFARNRHLELAFVHLVIAAHEQHYGPSTRLARFRIFLRDHHRQSLSLVLPRDTQQPPHPLNPFPPRRTPPPPLTPPPLPHF